MAEGAKKESGENADGSGELECDRIAFPRDISSAGPPVVKSSRKDGQTEPSLSLPLLRALEDCKAQLGDHHILFLKGCSLSNLNASCWAGMTKQEMALKQLSSSAFQLALQVSSVLTVDLWRGRDGMDADL